MSGKDYWGSDIRRDVVNNWLECQKRCQNMDECAYWTYDTNGNACYLKYAAAGNNIREAGSHTTTGPKYCNGKHNTKC